MLAMGVIKVDISLTINLLSLDTAQTHVKLLNSHKDQQRAPLRLFSVIILRHACMHAWEQKVPRVLRVTGENIDSLDPYIFGKVSIIIIFTPEICLPAKMLDPDMSLPVNICCQFILGFAKFG